MDEYAVVVLPDQRLDDDKQIAFASLYGPLELSPQVHSKDGAAGGDRPASRTATSSTSPISTNTAGS